MKPTFDNELYAVHKNGDRLYRPTFDAKGEPIPSGLPLVAISIDRQGKTFPVGATYLRDGKGHIKNGWTVVCSLRSRQKPSKDAHFSRVESAETRLQM